MRKILMWAAAVTFSFAAFLTSCATQPQTDEQKSPAAASHKQGADHLPKALSGFTLLSKSRAKPSSSATPTA